MRSSLKSNIVLMTILYLYIIKDGKPSPKLAKVAPVSRRWEKLIPSYRIEKENWIKKRNKQGNLLWVLVIFDLGWRIYAWEEKYARLWRT